MLRILYSSTCTAEMVGFPMSKCRFMDTDVHCPFTLLYWHQDFLSLLISNIRAITRLLNKRPDPHLLCYTQKYLHKPSSVLENVLVRSYAKVSRNALTYLRRRPPVQCSTAAVLTFNLNAWKSREDYTDKRIWEVGLLKNKISKSDHGHELAWMIKAKNNISCWRNEIRCCRSRW